MKKKIIIGITIVLIIGFVFLSGCVSNISRENNNPTLTPTVFKTMTPTLTETPSVLSTETSKPIPIPTSTATKTPKETVIKTATSTEVKYIVNLNTNKVHKPTCRYAKNLVNYKEVTSTSGYEKCKICF